ncbi:MAG: hypothetical protein VW920_04540 [Gammaproteobacteria bacterium]
MKKFFKYFLIFIIIGVSSLFVIPQARANFIGSVGEIIFSLRGVEEEAVNVFIPSPPEPEISLGNKESEALTAEQVLFEESITSLSASGSCDDSVGEENRSFAQRIANEDFSFGRSGLENYNINNFQNIANNISIEFSNESAFIRAKIKRSTDTDYVYKIFVNGNDITLTDFTNANEILFDKNSKDLNIKLKLFDQIGQTVETRLFKYTPQGNSDTSELSGDLKLEKTGISISPTEPTEGYETLKLPSGLSVSSTGDTNTQTVEFTDIPGATYYQIEFGSQKIYTNKPAYKFLNANQSFNATVKITLIDSNLVLGDSFENTTGREVQNSTTGTSGSGLDFIEKSGLKYTYNDSNNFGQRIWNTEIRNLSVTSDGSIGFNGDAPPGGEGYIVIGNDEGNFQITGWQTSWNEQDPNKFNILFRPPENFDGSFYFFSGRGAGRLTNKISVNLPSDLLDKTRNSVVSIDNPNFKPRFNKDIENLEAILAEKGSVLLYDLLGPTQVEFNWRPMIGADVWKTRAFNVYVDGNCVATQKAWNIKEGDGNSLMSQIDLITYAVIGRLPSMADVEVEVRAVGFNGVESEGEKGIIRTFLEPDVSLIDIGVIDTNWIVYGEFAYIYYHLSTTKQEYESYKASGNTFYLQAKMCCDENNLVYFPTIQFIPVPEYATCSDLTIVGKTSRDNPGFLGIRSNPDLSVSELIKDDDDTELSFEEAGGEVGDIIYSINGVDVFSEVQLADEINKYTGGQSLEVIVGRGGQEVILDVELTTYPSRFNIEEINKATGCFNANGQAIGVFKIKMRDGFKKDQYISSFYFYQKDSTATERLGEEAMIWGGNKEFNRNGNIYSGIGPADSLVSYGKHSVDFNKASFSVYSNYRRASQREVLDPSIQVAPISESNEDSGPVSQLEIFIPTETRNEPYSKYAKDYEDFEELQKKGIIPVVNGNSIGDCCYRDDIRSDAGRIFPKGTYSFYFKTNNPRILGGWDVYSETCSLVVFDLPYDYAVQNKNFLRNTYYPEKSDYPVLAEFTVNKEVECIFDLSEYRSYPYIAFNAKTCYVSKEDENTYFCIEIPYVILGMNSFG